MHQISIDQIFNANRDRLEMTWVAGHPGAGRMLMSDTALHPASGQVGHMNAIHPFRIQVFGVAEIAYLSAKEEDQQREKIERLFNADLCAIIVANNEKIPPYLRNRCDELAIPLFHSARMSPLIIDVLRLYLARELAESVSLHGVFLDVLEIGVLITGSSAIGKSELALELISRGHGLIADDVVDLYRTNPETLEGRCPALLKDFLEVRGIGILNIRTIFGETAVRPRKTLKLIVHLQDHSRERLADIDRLQVSATYQEILGVEVRKVMIPVAAGRNLAVLVEAAVRNLVLQMRGLDTTREFIERQQRLMENPENL